MRAEKQLRMAYFLDYYKHFLCKMEQWMKGVNDTYHNVP